MNLSERTYWALLITVFIGFSSVLGLWIIPQHLIEYSLGIGLLTSSVFMVLTIVFLSWLFNVREKREWQNVKGMVNLEIRRSINFLLSNMLTFIEGGNEIRLKIIKKEMEVDKKSSHQLCLAELIKLKNSSGIVTNSNLEFLFTQDMKVFNALFRPHLTKLGEILYRYSKFLSPKITETLMKIQNNLERMEECIQVDIGTKKLPLWKKELDVGFPESNVIKETLDYIKDENHQNYLRLQRYLLRDLFEEILEMNGYGFDIDIH